MRRSLTQWLRLLITLLLGWSALACSAVSLTLATTTTGYDGRNLPSFGYDPAQQPKPDYDGGSALAFSKQESQLLAGRALLAVFAEFVAAESADTIAEGLRISPYRVTAPGETFVRYESGNPAFTKITPSGGVKPQTFAAPASDGLISETATNSMAGATYLAMAPEQLLGVQGLAAMAGASSHISIQTPQATGHPHPGLSRSTLEAPARAVSPWSFLPTELGARLHRLCQRRCCTWPDLFVKAAALP